MGCVSILKRSEVPYTAVRPTGAGLQPDPLRMPQHEWHSTAGPFQCKDAFLHADNSPYLKDALAHDRDLLGIF